MSVERAVAIAGGGVALRLGAIRRRNLWQLFRRSRPGMTGALLVAIVAVAALAAPWITLRDPLALRPAVRLLPPGGAYWFGTDDFGRDLFSRVVYGSRLSLEVGTLVVLCSGAFGILAGQGGTLPFLHDQKTVEVIPEQKAEGPQPSNIFVVPKTWRLIVITLRTA